MTKEENLKMYIRDIFEISCFIWKDTILFQKSLENHTGLSNHLIVSSSKNPMPSKFQKNLKKNVLSRESTILGVKMQRVLQNLINPC